MKILPVKTEARPYGEKLYAFSMVEWNEYILPDGITPTDIAKIEAFAKRRHNRFLSPIVIDETGTKLGIVTVCEKEMAKIINSYPNQGIWCYYITGSCFCYNEQEPKLQDRILNRMLSRLLLFFKMGWNTNDWHHFTYIVFKTSEHDFMSKIMSAGNDVWKIRRYAQTDFYCIDIAEVIKDDMFNLDFIRQLCLQGVRNSDF